MTVLTLPPVNPTRSGSRRQARDLGAKIDAGGGRFGRLIVVAARRERLPIALACALVEYESGFRNVYGHDAVRNPIARGGPVTRENYLRYRAWRDQGLGSQRVGCTQLAWTAHQERADELGGCWRVENQLRVGFSVLAGHIRRYGVRGGLAAYNSGNPESPAGLRYAAKVMERRQDWERRLREAAPVRAPRPVRKQSRTLHLGLHGDDVALLQRTLNHYLAAWGAPEPLDPDGELGPKTELAFRRVRLVLGLALRRNARGLVLVSPRDRVVMRDPQHRNAAELERARVQGAAWERRLRARFQRERDLRGSRPKVMRLPLAFDTPRLKRNAPIHTTVAHQSGGPVDGSDREAIELCRRLHRIHRVERGWAGIGYHVCIARSGTIILLRPGWAIGAGLEGHSAGTFHVLFHGDVRRERPSRRQIESFRWFVEHGHEIDGIPPLSGTAPRDRLEFAPKGSGGEVGSGDRGHAGPSAPSGDRG
jgi:hypothetical protein